MVFRKLRREFDRHLPAPVAGWLSSDQHDLLFDQQPQAVQHLVAAERELIAVSATSHAFLRCHGKGSGDPVHAPVWATNPIFVWRKVLHVAFNRLPIPSK